MGGGYVSKEKFIDNEGKLTHYFKLENYPLCGGTPPIYLSSVKQLKNDNVGLIITLLLEPLHSGRTINHLPFDFGETEWTDGDIDIEQKIEELNMELINIPIHDGCPPTNNSINQLLNGVRDFINRRPNEKIYFHCWKGAGRTSVAMILILNCIWNIPLNSAKKIVGKANQKYKLSDYQIPYLNSNTNKDYPHLADDIYNEIYDPIIRTPANNECWIKSSKNDQID